MTTQSPNPGSRRKVAQPPAASASAASASADVAVARADLDALVAHYAPIGRRVRRQRLVWRVAAGLLVPILGIAGFQAWQAGNNRTRTVLDAPTVNPPAAVVSPQAADSVARIEQALAEFRQLKASVTASVDAQTSALSAQREELARQGERFQEQSALLVKQIAEINGQREALAAQSRQFDAQRSLLAEAIAKADSQRRQIETRQAKAGQQVPSLDRQLAEIARQRQSLEQQQQQFQDQSQLLAREIDRINAQRLEIERQQKAIEAQRAQVQGLLNQINEVGLDRLRQRKHGSPDEEPGEASVASATGAPRPPTGALATLAAVDTGVLGEMRGGIDTGEDFSVSIGITRTGSVNGIEQYSNAMYLEELTRTTGSGAPVSFDPVILQSGAGNLIALDTVSGLSPNVATIIQNTLDNQVISTQTILDISLQNVSTVIQGLSSADVVSESLSRQP